VTRSSARRRPPPNLLHALLIAFLLVLPLATVAPGSSAAAAPGASIPLGDDGRFVTNLSAPLLDAGEAGSLTFRLTDILPSPMTGVLLSFGIYAYVASLGSAPSGIPEGALQLVVGGMSGANASESLGTLAPGATVSGTVSVLASSAAPAGAYLIRTGLSFGWNGSQVRFESRGFFSQAQWEAATSSGPSAGPSPNLTVLGVDGIVPETSVGVRSNGWQLPIIALAAGGLALAAIGAFLYFRRGPSSSSGAVSVAAPQSAPNALGKKRTNDGDRNKS
jgi:hypothetical protein